jgi:hypothetical protein
MYYKINIVIYFLRNSSSALLTALFYVVLLSYDFEKLEFVTKGVKLYTTDRHA